MILLPDCRAFYSKVAQYFCLKYGQKYKFIVQLLRSPACKRLFFLEMSLLPSLCYPLLLCSCGGTPQNRSCGEIVNKVCLEFCQNFLSAFIVLHPTDLLTLTRDSKVVRPTLRPKNETIWRYLLAWEITPRRVAWVLLITFMRVSCVDILLNLFHSFINPSLEELKKKLSFLPAL